MNLMIKFLLVLLVASLSACGGSGGCGEVLALGSIASSLCNKSESTDTKVINMNNSSAAPVATVIVITN